MDITEELREKIDEQKKESKDKQIDIKGESGMINKWTPKILE